MGVQMTKMHLLPSGGADGDRSSPSLLRAGPIFLEAAKHKSEGGGSDGECMWGCRSLFIKVGYERMG
jgi:hypothetical protein